MKFLENMDLPGGGDTYDDGRRDVARIIPAAVKRDTAPCQLILGNVIISLEIVLDQLAGYNDTRLALYIHFEPVDMILVVLN